MANPYWNTKIDFDKLIGKEVLWAIYKTFNESFINMYAFPKIQLGALDHDDTLKRFNFKTFLRRAIDDVEPKDLDEFEKCLRAGLRQIERRRRL